MKPHRDYSTDLRLLYEKGRIDASFFTHLSLFHEGALQRALRSLAEIEYIMTKAILPLVRTRCTHPSSHAGDVLYLTGIQDANLLSGLSSSQLASKLAADFTRSSEDIGRVQSLGGVFPESEGIIRQYLEHEQAIVATMSRLATGCDILDGECSMGAWMARYAHG